MKRVVIAFSGGLDSTFLLKSALDTLGRNNVLAVTAKSAIHPEREYKSALALAGKLGIDYNIVNTKEMKDKRFVKNPVNRCYYCKRELLGKVLYIARSRNFNCVLDGFNNDDKKDIRYGSIAARELGVRSPLAEAGIGKKEIRRWSKQFGLSTWNKPPFACLASRIPYGDKITKDKLRRIDMAEKAINRCGFKQVRVRLYGSMARIEVPLGDINSFFNKMLRKRIVGALRKLGFPYVALDLEGYRMGSMNKVIAVEKHKGR